MDIEIKVNYNSIYAESMQQVYQSVGWNKHTIEMINQVFTVSTHVAISFKEDRLIGFGRALSDGVFNGAIYDLVVHTDEQGNGVAKEIINSLLTQLNPYLVST